MSESTACEKRAVQGSGSQAPSPSLYSATMAVIKIPNCMMNGTCFTSSIDIARLKENFGTYRLAIPSGNRFLEVNHIGIQYQFCTKKKKLERLCKDEYPSKKPPFPVFQ